MLVVVPWSTSSSSQGLAHLAPGDVGTGDVAGRRPRRHLDGLDVELTALDAGHDELRGGGAGRDDTVDELPWVLADVGVAVDRDRDRSPAWEGDMT